MSGAEPTSGASFAALAYAAGLERLDHIERLAPAAPITTHAPLVRRVRHARLKRTGGVIGRVWGAGFTDEEYRLLLVGGRRARLATPDAYTDDDVPAWHLSAYERRQAARALDRHCVDGFESPSTLCGPYAAAPPPRFEHRNTACNPGRSVLLNFIGNITSGYTGVQYFAVGVGAGTPNAVDQQLFSEFFRKQPSSVVVSGNQVLIATFFQTTEAIATYTEGGIFCSAPSGFSQAASGGTTASGSANTGVLVAHATYNYGKSSSVNLTNDYYVTEN